MGLLKRIFPRSDKNTSTTDASVEKEAAAKTPIQEQAKTANDGLAIHENQEISPFVALGAGCYWGTEKFIVKDFQKRFPSSIKSAKVGFMSPNPNAKKNPGYREVCSGRTGHVEVLFVELANPEAKIFVELIKFFFMFHDPTTKNRQGNDTGTQYASAIFCSDETQLALAEKVRDELQVAVDERKVRYLQKNVHTNIVASTEFYAAHEAHQQYLMKHPFGYCNHRYRFKSWPKVGEN